MTDADRQTITYKKQIEAVEAALPDRLSNVAAAVATASLVAFLLGSKDLLAWVNNLPIGPVSDFLLRLSQEWQDQMVKYGPAAFADAVTALLAYLQSLQW